MVAPISAYTVVHYKPGATLSTTHYIVEVIRVHVASCQHTQEQYKTGALLLAVFRRQCSPDQLAYLHIINKDIHCPLYCRTCQQTVYQLA